MLLGLLQPTRGSSALLGRDSRNLTPEILQRVGYMPESHPLLDWMTVRQLGDYQSSFYPRWNSKVFDGILGHFRLDSAVKAGQLSRGERAGLSLAMTLAPEPELLILDDPALGLDPVARRSLLESMLFVTRSADRTILFSSHLLDDVERVADYIAILDRGVLKACCPLETFRSSIRQFVLRYDSRERVLPRLNAISGVLHTRRSDAELQVTVVRSVDVPVADLEQCGATSIEEVPVSFAEAMVGYLGERGEQSSLLDDVAAFAAAGG
jgi:ABC-2 type transport system ATP-binding protein